MCATKDQLKIKFFFPLGKIGFSKLSDYNKISLEDKRRHSLSKVLLHFPGVSCSWGYVPAEL